MVDAKTNISFSRIGTPVHRSLRVGGDGAFSKPSPMFIGTPFHYAIWQKSYTLSTAREWDNESSTHYYRARNQDPRIGRFLSADPIGYDDGLNLYTYVENNPVIYVDPFGNATIYKAGYCNEGDICCLTWIYKWDQEKNQSADECVKKLKERFRVLFLAEYITDRMGTIFGGLALKKAGKLAWGNKIARTLKIMGWSVTGYEAVSIAWEIMFNEFCNSKVCTNDEPAKKAYELKTSNKRDECGYKILYFKPFWFCPEDAKYVGK